RDLSKFPGDSQADSPPARRIGPHGQARRPGAVMPPWLPLPAAAGPEKGGLAPCFGAPGGINRTLTRDLRCSLAVCRLRSAGPPLRRVSSMNGQASALSSHVLVLNKMWMAIRVIDARRAFSLLVRDLAEVIRVDDGSFTG